jgi:hypothetical protein
MAQLANRNTQAREFATDEVGMMADAKDYAKRDISTILKVFEMLKGVPEITEEMIVKATIKVKYEQINKARNERPSYERYFD